MGNLRETAAIEVSGRDLATIGTFALVGGGLGYLGGSYVKRPIIGAAVGATLAVGGLFLLVNRSTPESSPVQQQ